MSQRFDASARLRSRAEFTAVQTSGRRAAGRYLTLLGQPNSLERDRLGIIASKRVGSAVDRNRAKRRVREVFRRSGMLAPDIRHLDFVAICRPELPHAPFAALVADFNAALKKLRAAR